MSENTKDMTPGLVSWNELMTHDPVASAKFYTELFGWKAETENMGGWDYTFFSAGDRPAGGMIKLPPEAGKAPTAWMGYVTVADLSAAVEKAKQLGAHVCKDATTLPFGRFAIISDPQGAVLGLWEFAKTGCGQ